jgi:hypothetical protein
MNFLNSAFDSSNFIESNVNCNQWIVPQINTTTNNNNNNNNTSTSTGDSTKPTNFIMKNSNPALNRTYCSKKQLYFEFTKFYIFSKKQVLRNFKFYQTFKPRPSQNSNTFFFSKLLKTYLKIYFNQFRLIKLKKKNF